MVMAIPRAVVALSLTLLLLVVSPLCTAEDNILYSGETLPSGEYLFLRGGSYTFIMQADCNLVLYDHDTGNAEWATMTGGLAKDCYLKLHSDGNLVIYTQDNKAVWASNTNREEGHYALILQKNRNVVIYGGAIWATNTVPSGTSTGAIVITSKASTMEGFLPANATQYGSNAAARIGRLVVNN